MTDLPVAYRIAAFRRHKNAVAKANRVARQSIVAEEYALAAARGPIPASFVPDLARRLNVHRVTVWKDVKAIRRSA